MGRQGERHAAERGSDEQLHRGNPPTFRLDEVDERAPQRFDDPRKVEPRGVERDFRVGKSQLFVQENRDGHNGHVGQSLGEIE